MGPDDGEHHTLSHHTLSHHTLSHHTLSHHTLSHHTLSHHTLSLQPWDGEWDATDPDAAFKAEVAEYSQLDPLLTLRGLSDHLGVPVGSLARYILAKWASAGSDGLLEIGPSMVSRLLAPIREAERADTDEARLAAFHKLAGMISWLHAPLD